MTADELVEQQHAIAQATFDEVLTGLLESWDEPSLEQVTTAMLRVGRNSMPALVASLYCEDLLTPEVAAFAVPEAWTMNEYPEDHLDRELWLTLFDHAGYTLDGETAERPTEPIRLYRGAPNELAQRMSWTSELAVAKRFASGNLRGRLPGVVWTALVEPKRILAAILDGREEAEHVVNADGLTVERWTA